VVCKAEAPDPEVIFMREGTHPYLFNTLMPEFPLQVVPVPWKVYRAQYGGMSWDCVRLLKSFLYLHHQRGICLPNALLNQWLFNLNSRAIKIFTERVFIRPIWMLAFIGRKNIKQQIHEY